MAKTVSAISGTVIQRPKKELQSPPRRPPDPRPIPGAQLFETHGTTLYPFIFSLFLTNISLVVIGFGALRLVARNPATVDPECPPCLSNVLSCPSEVPMAKALDDLPDRMTVEEFMEWLDRWPDDPAFELIEGVPVAMAPGRAIHARLKAEIWLALREGIRAADLQCEAFIDGIGIRVDECSVYQPDVMVHCGERVDDESRLVPEPLIVVEVLSPTTQHVDTGRKLEGYFRVPSIVHYLIAPTDRRVVIHHRRTDDERIETRIVTSGVLELDPPGINLDIERLNG